MYLNCHSHFSFNYGTLSIKDLVARAKAAGCRNLALTDINTTSGLFDFIKECKKADIKAIVGVEFRNSDEVKYTVLAKNQNGLHEINRFLSEYLASGKPYPQKAPPFRDSFAIYPMSYFESNPTLDEHEYIGVRFWELTRLFKFHKHSAIQKVLAIHTVTFHDKITFNLHRLLRAISKNVLLSKLPKNEEACPDEIFVDIPTLIDKFADYRMFMKNTALVINNCNFEFNTHTDKNKRFYTKNKETDMEFLRKLTLDGASNRYDITNAEVIRRIDKELAIISQMNFAAYFLMTWDIINYARTRGYFHVGRGSGANSIVAYCIGITDVDPIELDLYFERFINPERTSPPDFDIDFSWDERDEIIQYIFKRYGKEHVCLLATYNTFQRNSAIRELAKVFGLPKPEVDMYLRYPERAQSNEYMRYILKYAPLMDEMPNNLSIHAGGILISEEPLFNYTALQPMPKGFPICQWDMYVAEEIGFAKFDVLSQRGLGHIKMAVDLVRDNHRINIDIHQVHKFKKDENIRKQLQANETMGCFYIESPAMRQLMWKLRCDNYLTLVAASSIIRPGVASSGMMKAYIERHHDPHNIQYLHPRMKDLLEDTYGVMIYQEDVIKVAHGFAKMTLGEADMLRRAMSGKYRARMEFQKIVDKWFANCRAEGYSDELAKEVWRQVESFAGYSFSKAHSASYAVESYQSLYLKTYFPLEFITAVINNFGGFYRTEFYIHEAKRCGATIEVPDINESNMLTGIKGKTIWLGWIHIKSLEVKIVKNILDERNQKGRFLSFADFAHRVPIGLEQLIVLIRVGAFRNFGMTKKELLWEAHLLLHNNFKPSAYKEALFEYLEPETHLPALSYDPLEDMYDEIEFLDFTVGSPFDLCAEPVSDTCTIDKLHEMLGQPVNIYGYLITWKSVRAKNGQLMGFGYFYDYSGKFFDTVHFPKTVEKYPLRGSGIYHLCGKVVEDFGFYSIEVESMRKVELKPDPRSVSEPISDASLAFVISD
ncbi:DNA polymerase III subunit alpha [Emticicia sp. TH156]|uniref:DNA polymerase III subunit alpha n=1 Tax=Emticicia sp. TH156 TaxID=2067454 RepID=UPI000C774E3F|nr:DNA polymerase III subunit alpha [Emticicia sp. TH156]PLK45396.1 DNA polymerase III subunit alpha [Emticicia sp. TH156]